MKKFKDYQYTGGEMSERDKREVDSKFWGKGKWDNFIEPFFPSSCTDMTLVDMGCNAGLFLKLAEDRGFSDVIGVDSDREAIKKAFDYGNNNGGNYPLHHRRIEESIDKLPVADVTLLVNTHYYLEVSDFLDYIDKLRSKTRYCLIVTGDKNNDLHMASADSNSIRDYFNGWDEFDGVKEISSKGDPAPRRLWTLCFGSPLITRILIDQLDNGNHQQYGFCKQIDEGVPLEKTDYYRGMKSYRLKEHKWSMERFVNSMISREDLYRDVKERGLMKPIIINKKGRIIDGNHRCEMMRHLGYKSILARRVI